MPSGPWRQSIAVLMALLFNGCVYFFNTPVKKVITRCLEKKIPCLSLFAFSSENWSRPATEVQFLMELFLESIKKELPQLKEKGIRIRFGGNKEALSQALQQQMQEAQEATESNSQLLVNVLVNYGGKWDLLSAAKKLAQSVIDGQLSIDTVQESHLEQFLDTNGLPEPDLFIRTSGELRISNFYLWQLAYTELYFTTVLWPDFDAQEFDLALDAFSKRKRRFGQV